MEGDRRRALQQLLAESMRIDVVLGAHRGGTAAMKKYIGCDAHTRYSILVVMDENGRCDSAVRVGHDEGEMRRYLATLPPGSAIALETSGNWYWLVRAMEEAGLDPRLAHAGGQEAHAGEE